MNGARAEPAANHISAPNKSMTIIIGSSQNFFLTLRNCQISLRRDITVAEIELSLTARLGRASAVKSFRAQNERSNCSLVCREFSRGIQ